MEHLCNHRGSLSYRWFCSDQTPIKNSRSTDLKHLPFWNQRTEEGLKQALGYFQQAIETDSTYALAYAGPADAYTTLGYGSYLAPEAPPCPILSGMSRPRWAALHHSGALW